MQLGTPTGIRQRLGAAACLLLAGAMPAAAQPAPAPPVLTPPAANPTWQFDGSALLYGEQNRAKVFEPTGRITRFFASGQSLSAQFALDAMTGASPTGALPTGQVQTTTSSSGNVSTSTVSTIPTAPFHDLRGAFDLSLTQPVGSLLNTTVSGHFSREKDYQSLGVNGSASLDILNRLATVTVGGGYNKDGVFPVIGTAPGLVPDSTAVRVSGTNPKNVATGLVGLSRVMSRRWLLGVTASRTIERGYLTDPYKVISVVDPNTQLPIGQLTEKRPDSRTRNDVLASSVYHFESDVFYLNDRYYWDGWGVNSNTIDLKLRHDLNEDSWVQPHIRFYQQTRAQFFVFGLIHGPPLPSDASADDRLGPLHTVTVGATYGWRIPGHAGEFTLRAEYMYQWVTGRPSPPAPTNTLVGDGARALAQDDGSQNSGQPAGTNIGTVLFGYSVPF